MDKFNRFNICYLDILGFENILSREGLGSILSKYERIMRVINGFNEHMSVLFDKVEFKESAYWTSDPDIFIFSRVFGAYASDSIVIFSNTDFPENRYPAAISLSEGVRESMVKDPSNGWKYHPIPCDDFLNMCCEVVCQCLEIGLPVRGAITMGEAVLHLDRSVFIGAPLVEAARLEKSQKLIGASIASSFAGQIIPPRFLVKMSGHFKNSVPENYSGYVLDWPRHWRKTRGDGLSLVIDAMDNDEIFSLFYENTKKLIFESGGVSELYCSPLETSVRAVYPQFASDDLRANVRAIRTVPISDEINK